MPCFVKHTFSSRDPQNLADNSVCFAVRLLFLLSGSKKSFEGIVSSCLTNLCAVVPVKDRTADFQDLTTTLLDRVELATVCAISA